MLGPTEDAVVKTMLRVIDAFETATQHLSRAPPRRPCALTVLVTSVQYFWHTV
jgi:hypothetical protein